MGTHILTKEVRALIARGDKNQGYHEKILDSTPSGTKVKDTHIPQVLQTDDRKVDSWVQITGELAVLGLLDAIDERSLIRYCNSWVQWLDTQAFIDEKGLKFPVYDVKKVREFNEKEGGYISKEIKVLKDWKVYPEVAQASRLAGEMLQLEKEFGMTPVARARIGIKRAGGGEAANNAPIANPFKYV